MAVLWLPAETSEKKVLCTERAKLQVVCVCAWMGVEVEGMMGVRRELWTHHQLLYHLPRGRTELCTRSCFGKELASVSSAACTLSIA